MLLALSTPVYIFIRKVGDRSHPFIKPSFWFTIIYVALLYYTLRVVTQVDSTLNDMSRPCFESRPLSRSFLQHPSSRLNREIKGALANSFLFCLDVYGSLSSLCVC
nr:hypothetical protein Q903MT_gene2065 [Picea sitchensis]